MTKAYTVVANLDRELPESELDELVKDLHSFKQYARVNGKLGGVANRMINVYDETTYNHVNDKFGGKVRVYLETDDRNAPIEDMVDIFRKYDATVTHFSAKWSVV